MGCLDIIWVNQIDNSHSLEFAKFVAKGFLPSRIQALELAVKAGHAKQIKGMAEDATVLRVAASTSTPKASAVFHIVVGKWIAHPGEFSFTFTGRA